MKTTVKPNLGAKTFRSSKNYTRLRKKEFSLFDYKFYQKLFFVLISLSTILIFSESPKELEDICESYYSSEICIVW